MNPEIIATADGSSTLYVKELDETYHSRHGAVQESQWVFIDRGFIPACATKKQLSILEIGFGTGLNAWLTFNHCEQHSVAVKYTTLEPLQLPEEVWGQLHFPLPHPERFSSLHTAPWDEMADLSGKFSLHKLHALIQNAEFPSSEFDLVYYDAFGPRVQPAMWEREIFSALFSAMNEGAILVTYCAKGQVRRDLCAVGFSVERLAGPPGKREMLRATKTTSPWT